MDDKFTPYEKALSLLYKKIDKKHPLFNDFCIYELQLKENMRDARLHGESENSRSERSRILAQMNRLSQECIHYSFNTLCDKLSSKKDESNTKNDRIQDDDGITEFHVFLCHNAEDTKIVKEIGSKLIEIGLKPWLDEWELRPGLPWQETLERQIRSINSAAVFVGKSGVGPWQNSEVNAFIRQFVKRKSPVIPVILPDCIKEPDLPIFLEGFTWVDFRKSAPDPLLQLKWGITGKREPSFQIENDDNSETSSFREGLSVIPINSYLPEKEPPEKLSIPQGYKYLGKLEKKTTDHLYRTRDGHVSLWFTAIQGDANPFLIDKYVITAKQFSQFLNDLLEKGIIRMEHGLTKFCVDSKGKPVAHDALSHWKKGSTIQRPWLYASRPWGMTFQDGNWKPVSGSELLPATHVTWWGARLYSLWAHGLFDGQSLDQSAYLPTVAQWQEAAQREIPSARQRRYPWGDTWMREYVNHAGYWAGREVREEKWENLWATQVDIFQSTRPLLVADLIEGGSSIGCVQMLGNVWEWCSDNPIGKSSAKAVKGGACLSPMEHCSTEYTVAWRPNQGNEYIGFRCCYPL